MNQFERGVSQEGLETKEKPANADNRLRSSIRGIAEMLDLKRQGVNVDTAIELYVRMMGASLREARDDSDSFPQTKTLFVDRVRKGVKRGKGAVSSGISRIKAKRSPR